MLAVRRRAIYMMALMFPRRPAEGQPVFSSLSTPYQFNPCLGWVEGLIAVFAVFARILTLCVIFAVWSVMSLLWWNLIPSRLWRLAALVPILLALPATLIPPMLAIGAIERWMQPRHR
jgi:hypothetical protein